MRKKRKLLTSIFTAALMAALAVTPVAAEGGATTPAPTPTPFIYEPISGDDDDCTFTKELEMDTNANVPPVEFSFSIEAGSAIGADPETPGKLAVLAGAVVTDDGVVTAPSIDDVIFASNNPTTSSENQDKKIATQNATIDFSRVSFSEPGVYRYIITETALSTDSAFSIVGKNTRTLDVYVEEASATDDADGTTPETGLKIAGYVLYDGTVTAAPNVAATKGNVTEKPNGAEAGTKSDGFKNSYDTADLTFGKEVKGNQGSKDKYFKFTVEISNAKVGTVYDVDLSHADTSIAAKPNAATTCITKAVTNPSKIIATRPETDEAEDDESETDTVIVSTTFYLQDGQYITIKGLAKGTEYKVIEDAEDYTSESGIDKEDKYNI
ncbi:MAG: hypothetical protein Q4C77_10830 [Eubacteriales bacterium]|nr:hypothetical protein [Eubacteriales bacterium]